MEGKIHLAERRAVPGLIGMAGPSGSGKTFSALLLAAGMCTKGKRIGLIDTEKGRGEHYADNPIIKANLPEGYDVLQLEEPFSPDRYYEAIQSFHKKGIYDVVIIDSTTHEWDGFGGCADIAENNKLGGTANWAMAKKEHKRFMRKALTMPFTVIFCIRAQEKTAVNRVNGKMVFTDLGMQPVQEKNFKYEMLIACMLDPYTKFPIADNDFHKVPDDLRELFQPGRYITREDGIKLKKWIDGGKAINGTTRALEADFRTASNDGLAALQKFWGALTKDQQKTLEPIKEECKKIAAEADRQFSESNADNTTTDTLKPVQKSLIKPEVKNDKTQDVAPAGPQVQAPAQDNKPVVGSAKIENVITPTTKPIAKAEPEKPTVQAQPKPAPITPTPRQEPEKEVVPQETGVFEAVDEASQNAQEIADALTQEEDEETAVSQDEVEIELL